MTCSQGCCPTQREHWLSVAVAPSATPSRHPEALEVKRREKQWDRDMPAYRTLRHQGLQPKAIDGSADLAQRANSQLEVEMGHLFSKSELPRALEGMEMARQIKEDAAQ